MPKPSFASRCKDAPVFRHIPRYAGVAVALFGLLIVISWHAHWRPILQWVPESGPMLYNTALCFVLSGSGLFLLSTRRASQAPWPAGTAAFFSLLTLLEYLGEWDFRIDELFFKPYFTGDPVHAGRMPPLAAVCFIFIGLGITLVGAKRKWTYRVTAAGMLASVVGVIALVALISFIFGMEPVYGWGSYSRMAINTAVAFSILGGGLLVWSWQTVRRENLNFLRWLPVTASVTLMIMIAFVSLINSLEFNKAVLWRKHTVEVILTAQTFAESLTALQRGEFGPAAAGHAIEPPEPRQLDHLAALTGDNPGQQRRLKDLAGTMKEVIAYDRRVAALRRQPGFSAAPRSDDEGRRVFDRAHDILNAFSREEERLLDRRDVAEQLKAHSAARLLIFGRVLAAVLLVAANFMVGREMNRRQRAEIEREKLIAELRRLLDEVKMLSGMIPICGWCKSIRSDEGYWQTVEQYVREHTDATFTHGICPSCAEKMRAQLRESNPAAIG